MKNNIQNNAIIVSFPSRDGVRQKYAVIYSIKMYNREDLHDILFIVSIVFYLLSKCFKLRHIISVL